MSTFIKNPSKYGVNDPRQKKITDALLMFVASDLLPISIVESSHFQHFVQCLDSYYKIPSRPHFTDKLLRGKCDEIFQMLKVKLTSAKSVNLTIDLWSNRQMRGFLGITAHFITDWTLNSVMLACSRFRGHHTAENISEHVDDTVASFAISRKLDHITTDNASNMVKAFRLPGFGADDTCASTPESDDTYDETPEPVSI